MKTNTDTLGRRSRIHAQSTGKRITLQARDWLWLEKLHRHGPLASSFLLQFSKHLGKSEKRAKERLTDLFNEDNTAYGGPYLTRPLQQFRTIDSRYNQLVYDLAPAGIAALKERGFWKRRNGPSGGPWWHKFMVSSITGSIELTVAERDDLTLIPQVDILERAETELAYPVEFVEPSTKRRIARTLQPDALFGLEYHTSRGSRFRFFVVEADRATEPLSSSSNHRKSMRSNLHQYHEFIVKKLYRKHLKLTAPMLVLIVTTRPQRQISSLKLVSTEFAALTRAVLHQHWTDFSTPTSIPSFNPEFVRGLWLLGDGSGICVDH